MGDVPEAASGGVPAEPEARARLLIMEGAGAGSSVAITRLLTTIGRHPGCGVVLEDVTVSRHHAALHFQDGEWTLVDAGSANGTYLNGNAIRLADLGDGDEIGIGTFRLVFRTR